MHWFESVCVAIMLISGSFLAAGGYILQRDEYWRRVWKDLGEPRVGSVRELKILSEKLPRSSYSSRSQTSEMQSALN